MEYALTVKNLKKQYADGPEALKGIDLEIKKGEFFGLLGPNGAGKTTLINILCGVVNKTEGEVKVSGFDLVDNPVEVKYALGVMPQEVVFDPFFTVEETLKFQSGYFGDFPNQERVEWLLEKTKLTEKRDTPPRQLSGGMKRRLLLAKALVHQPDILILDEPTAGVDVELRLQLYDFVRELNESGITVILTTHYLEEAEELCDRIAILDKGEIVAIDKNENLMKHIDQELILDVRLKKKVESLDSLKKFKPEIKGEHLQLRFLDEEYQDVISALVKSGVDFVTFEVVKPSLEDVFLSLTNSK